MLGWLDNTLAWMRGHESVVVSAAAISLFTFVGSIAVVTALIVRMPANYFDYRVPPPDSWRGRHPAVRIAFVALKNILGLIIVAIGLVLLLPGIPGQGVLTVLIGITLLNFPGKRKLELRFIRFQPVLRAVNWIRAKNHRPPLVIPAQRAT